MKRGKYYLAAQDLKVAQQLQPSSKEVKQLLVGAAGEALCVCVCVCVSV